MQLTSGNFNDIVSFTTVSPSILGDNFQFVKVKGILDANSARQFRDVAAIHIALQPSLPVGTPSNPDNYQFVKIQFPNGTYDCIGLPWIVAASVVVNTSTQFNINVREITADDYEPLRQMLIQNGYPHFTITPV